MPSPTREVTYEDYNGKQIGIATGTNLEAESFKYFPNSEYLYFDGYPGLSTALDNGGIDAFLGDEPALKSIHAQQPQIDYINERLTNNYYSFAFRKDDPREKELRDQFNEFLREIKADGTYAEIDATWFGTDESKKVVDMSGLTGENGTIHVVTTSTDEPFSYIKEGQHMGYDIDVAVRFCRACGYDIEIGNVDFQARIPALQSGQYDFTTTMNVTPEREEAVLFTDAVSEDGIVVAVLLMILYPHSGRRACRLDRGEGHPAGGLPLRRHERANLHAVTRQPFPYGRLYSGNHRKARRHVGHEILGCIGQCLERHSPLVACLRHGTHYPLCQFGTDALHAFGAHPDVVRKHNEVIGAHFVYSARRADAHAHLTRESLEERRADQVVRRSKAQ